PAQEHGADGATVPAPGGRFRELWFAAVSHHSGRAARAHPEGENVKLFAVAAFAAVLATGSYVGYKVVEDPRSQLFGHTVVQGPKDEKIAALPFDAGPNPPYTNRILDV